MRGALLACALLVLAGCSSSQQTKTLPMDSGPATIIAPTPDNEAGPAEADLPKALDLPLYPGAKIESNTVGRVAGQPRYHVTLTTTDSPQKVFDFYKAQGIPQSDSSRAMGSTKNGSVAIVEVKQQGANTEITIRVSPSTEGR